MIAKYIAHRRYSLLIVSFSVFLILSGCQIQAQYAFSDPTLIEASDIKVENGRFYFPDIELFVRSWNRKGTGQMVFPVLFPVDVNDRFSPPYRITLQFTPRKAGFSLDTGQTMLSDLQNGKIVAKGIAGGSIQGKNTLVSTIAAGPNRNVVLENHLTTIIQLEFETVPPDPDENFSLDIAGLKLNGGAYPMARIQFRKKLWTGTLH